LFLPGIDSHISSDSLGEIIFFHHLRIWVISHGLPHTSFVRPPSPAHHSKFDNAASDPFEMSIERPAAKAFQSILTQLCGTKARIIIEGRFSETGV
jgi:hypothetical protein